MAYDQSSYQAPGRAYYDQHQQAPVQRHNGGYPPQQQYDNYNRSYDQGYGYSQPQNGGYYEDGYDMNQQSGHYYGDNGASNGYGHDQYAQGYSGQQDYRHGGHPQQPNGYGRPDEGYMNGHQEDYNSRQYDPREQQRPSRGHPHQPNGQRPSRDGYAEAQHNGNHPQDRQYDPRYQQRPNRGGQQPSDGPRSHRPPPISTNHQDYKGQQARAQAQGRDPRNGQPESGQGYPVQAPQRHGQDPRNGHGDRRGAQDVRDRSEKRPPTSQSNGGSRQAPPPAQDPKKSAMEEWKAKEKARMHEAANQPKSIPQDNAFPTFGVVKKDEKGQEVKSARSSEEQGRPSTSSGRNGSRPGSSKSNHQHQMSPQSNANGQTHHQPHSTRALQPFSPIHEQPMQEHSPHYAQERGEFGRDQSMRSQGQPSNQSHRQPPMQNNSAPRGYDAPNPPAKDRMPPRTYSADAQQPIGRKPLPTNQGVVSPPQAPTHPTEPQPETTSATQSDEYYPQESWRTGPPRKRPQQANAAPKPAAAPLQESYSTGPSTTRAQDSSIAQQPQPVVRAATLPTVPPPQVAPPPVNQAPSQTFNPDTYQPRPVDQSSHAPTRNFARPHVAPAVQSQEQSLDDFYDDYYGEEQSASVSVPAPPRNRDEEIEAEMPDFDSAAPGQKSGVQKRQAPQPNPAMSAQHVNASAQSLPVRNNQPYENYQEPAVASQPELRDVRHDQGGLADGFVFGVPGEQVRPQQQYDDRRQMQPPQQPMGYRPVQSVPPEDMRRYQSPADHRQMNMPIRNGPPGQHPQAQQFHPGNRGPLPPPQRSESARPPIAQAGWSDPGMQGMQRAPTAPPPRQDSYGMPQPGMPRAGTMPNQPFRAPSAPPGQQHMRGMPPRGPPQNGPPFNQQQGPRPSLQEQRPSDPDSLPHHPAPYRPGLMEQGAPLPPKPAPARSYDTRSSTESHRRQESVSDKPITKAGLEQARLDMEASPASPRLALRYAKKLVEASHILASEGGRLDAKATQRNREKWLNEAYKRVKDLVRNTYPEAQFYMAECYGSGEMGLSVDPKEAFALYQAAAKGGHAAAAFRTAVSCEIGPEEGGGTRKDYPKAVQWYRRAAALGDVAAMYKLGIVLLRGLLGVPRNVGEAVIWLKRAAERADADNPHALHELATLHEPTNTDREVREKVIPDEAYALSLFKQAADYGFKRSQFRLGQAYEYGSLGLEIDNRASIAWYTKAAAQGEHNAELALSGWYLTGAEGMLEQSDMEAYLWARKAAQAEPPLAKAMFAMGYFTEQGIGCPRSLEEAKRWYGRAASFQFPRALERLEELRKGGKNKSIQNGKLTRDKKKDDENCVVM